jgi:beta-xylosidase
MTFKKILTIIILIFSFICINAQTYTNYVKKHLADPFVYYEDGKYYMYGTDFAWAGFWVYTSTDLVNWTSGHECLHENNAYGDDNFWAPEVIKKGDYYYMFYTANYGLCVARSESPEGPFKAWGPNGGSLRTNSQNLGQWCIDGHYFKDEDGKEYMYYARIGQYGIWVAEINEELTSLSNDILCFNQVTQPETWVNTQTNEGPQIIKKDSIYYLFYSGNGYCNNYAVGYATSASPTGPWTKFKGNPILKPGNGQTNIGHNSFAYSPDSTELFIVYHRDLVAGESCSSRAICIDRIFFEDGIWKVPGGPTNTPQPYPSSPTTGNEFISADREFQIFPNPLINNQFTIEIPRTDYPSLSILILDLSGRKIFRKDFDYSEKICVELPGNLQHGIYILTVSNGRLYYSEKIIY